MAKYYRVEQNGEFIFVDAGGKRVPEEELNKGFETVTHKDELASSKVKTITQSGKYGYQTLDGQPLVDCVLDYDIKTAQGFVDAMSSLKANYIKLIQRRPDPKNIAQLRQALEQDIRSLHEARAKIVAYQRKLEKEATANPVDTDTNSASSTKNQSTQPTKTPLGNGITMLRDAQGHFGYEDSDGNVFIPCNLPIDVSVSSREYNASVTALLNEYKTQINSCPPSERQAVKESSKQIVTLIQSARQAYISKVQELDATNSTSTAPAEPTKAKPSTTKTPNREEIKQKTNVADLSKARLIKDLDKINIYYIDDDKKYVVTDKGNNQLHVFDKVEGFQTSEKLSGKYAKVTLKEPVKRCGFLKEDGSLMGEGCVYDYIKLFVTHGYAVAECGKKLTDGTTKCGLLTAEGNYIGEGCVFDTVSQSKEGVALVKYNGKFGYLKADGTFLGGKCEYDMADSFKNGMAVVEKGHKKGYINAEGELITNGYPFDSAYSFDENGFAEAGNGDKVGLIGKDCKYVGEGCVYDHVDCANSQKGLYRAEKDGKWGIIDTTGKLVTEGYNYDEVLIGTILIPVKSGDKYAYVNLNGKQVTDFIYTNFTTGAVSDHFLEEMRLVPVCIDDKWGFINENGQTVLECCLSNARDYNKEDVLQKNKELNENKSDLANTTKEEPTKANKEETKAETVKANSGELKKVEKDGKYGLVNEKGEEVIKCVYDKIDILDGYLARVSIDGEWGLINNEGEEIVECAYDFIGLEGDYISVKRHGKWGFINKNGEEIVKCIYNDLGNLNQDYIRAKKGDKYGFINNKGEVIIEFNYDYVDDFEGDLASAKKDGKWGIINKKGEEIVECAYDYIENYLSKHLFAIKKDGKWGFFNKERKNAIKCIYDSISSLNYDFVLAKKDGKWGVVDKNGEEILKCNFTDEEAKDILAKIENGTFNPENYKQGIKKTDDNKNKGVAGNKKDATADGEGVTGDDGGITA